MKKVEKFFFWHSRAAFMIIIFISCLLKFLSYYIFFCLKKVMSANRSHRRATQSIRLNSLNIKRNVAKKKKNKKSNNIQKIAGSTFNFFRIEPSEKRERRELMMMMVMNIKQFFLLRSL